LYLDEILFRFYVLDGPQQVFPVSFGTEEILGFVLYFLDDNLNLAMLIRLLDGFDETGG